MTGPIVAGFVAGRHDDVDIGKGGRGGGLQLRSRGPEFSVRQDQI